MKIPLIIPVFTMAMLLQPAPLLAQDASDVGHGREIARTICSACHVVVKGQLAPPNSEAPPFPARNWPAR